MKYRSLKVMTPLLVALSMVACEQGDPRMVERARIEAKAQAESEIGEQNRNLAIRAAQMEADLSRRQRFYQAVAGTYEGSMRTEGAEFRIRLTFVPSVPPVPSDRVRTLEEIAYDLTQLSFHVQVQQWNPVNPLSAVGCRIQNVRPDLLRGLIQIAAESCPNFYSLELADTRSPGSKAPELASNLTDGRTESIPELQGEVRPTTNAAVFHFVASKQER